MKQCTNPPSTTDGAGAASRPMHAESRVKGTSNTMTATSTATTTVSTVTPGTSSTSSVSSSGSSTSTVPSKCSSTREVKGEPKSTGGKAGSSEHPMKPAKHHVPYPPHHYPLHHHLQHHHQMSAKVNGKLGAGVDHLSALNLLPAHLRDMFLAAHLLRGYYQPIGPLISPHILPQPPTSQHGPGLGGLLGKSGPDGGSPLPGPQQPPASSTADSTDSDVLLTGTPGRPSVPPTDAMSMAFHPYRPTPPTAAAAAAAADADRCFRSIFAGGDLTPRSSQHQQQQQQQQQQQAAAYAAASRYGPAAGGPPANLYGRPMQMHCPPAYLPQSYYAPSPYGAPPPHPPPPEMYYTHAYPPAHYYPKFAPPQYYPAASRRYYPGPAPGPEHLYEQAPPGGAPVPQPPPPPAGAQLVPAGPPQGPQHLEHYPYPAYPGYGSPGPGSGGQCYPRNLPHPPPFLDGHYTPNCCQTCPKNVNAGSLIGIKASKGPVATNNNKNNTHIVQSQTSTNMSTEPIAISSGSSTASSTASPAPAPLDIHTPIAVSSESTATADPAHGYHHLGGHHHHPYYHPHHHHHQYPMPPVPQPAETSSAVASTTVAPSVVTVTTTHPTIPPGVVTTASSADHHYHHHHLQHQQQQQQPPPPHHPSKMCYKTEQLIKPESSPELHYGSPYHHHHYHHPAMGYYHHPKLTELKEEPEAALGTDGGKLGSAPLPPPYSITGKMALLETPELSKSPARGSTGLSIPPGVPGEAMQPPIIARDGEKKTRESKIDVEDEKISSKAVTNIPPKAVVKQEIEEFIKLDLGLVGGGDGVGAVCKKENFEETGPAMTPDLLDESIVIKKDRDEEKPPKGGTVDGTYQATHLHHQHHLQLGPPAPPPTVHHLQQVDSHHPPHLHHHSASTKLLQGPPTHYPHHVHSQYTMNNLTAHEQQQLQPPQLAAGLPTDTNCDASNLLLSPDSKSLLTDLVLTTEASMVARVASSKSISSTTTTTSTSSGGTIQQQQQPRESSSSDNSLSLSDSLAIPSADAKVQSHEDDGDNEPPQSMSAVDPASPVTIPASTVKRRPLLVACKKPTPKQSPPNSYKNLIKRTNSTTTDEGGELREAVECIEAIELSEDEEEVDEEEEEEEEVDDEEVEEDEEDDNEEDEEEENADEGDGEEDVEHVELEEQRKVLAEQQQRQRGAGTPKVTSRKVSGKKRSGTTKLATDGARRKGTGCARKLLTTTTTTAAAATAILTPRDKQRRSTVVAQNKSLTPSPPPLAAPRRSRKFVKRVHRVFRASIESLKRLPPSLRGRLLGRSKVTFVPVRRTVRKRPLKSPELTPSTEETCERRDEQGEKLKSPNNSNVNLAIDEKKKETLDRVSCASVLLDLQQNPSVEQHPDASDVAVEATNDATEPTATKTHLSNVDRTIDLVARGYFSEPEILTASTDPKQHSRAWLKKLKQQQQQEGRSHSEQSRTPVNSKSAGCPATSKAKKKASPLADGPRVPSVSVEDRPADKKKSKFKSSKKVPTADGTESPAQAEGKGKKKSSTKEPKKESSKKKKQKAQDDGDELHGRSRKRAKVNKANAAKEAPIEEPEAMYQRATSTPIPPLTSNHGSMLATGDEMMEPRETEEDQHPKGGSSMLDESGGTLMDHSSVIDDFDDAATMLVEDDVASVDTSVLVTRHNNNNNNSAVVDKNNPSDEQQCTIGGQITLDEAPLQAVIAEGKEGSELEPPEGMEPFLDDDQEDEQQQQQLDQLRQPMPPTPAMEAQILLPPPVLTQQYVSAAEQPPMRVDYGDDDDNDDDDEELEEEEEFVQKRACSRSVKRRRSRSKTKAKKFSSKKRHRPSNRGATADLEELIVPRKCNSIPRWSNGWTWEGQPFKGKVFLNSDGIAVVRTCYPAMRHSVGDIIRPRDCVLLRAGNTKRAELPYVAKVAHLWENPDDGEMMMSLLWYYRPEHTEQGRQRTDGPDEVFASRHKDHNSVACIEDKCYVLTFSEYCRFRRQLKGAEENIDEQPSIVPPLRRENPRLPPSNVAAELVMYCQRVYEFRLKRLLKSTS